MARRRALPGGAPRMIARAGAQVGDGASTLFARLDALGDPADGAAKVLERLAERLRAGVWTPALAELVSQAEAVERTLPPD